jgi:hypothetical protein
LLTSEYPQFMFEPFDKVQGKPFFAPELNMGQLARVLTSEYPQFRFETHYKIKGKPFQAFRLKEHFDKILEEMS